MGSGLNQREAWILTPVRLASVWRALSAVKRGRHGVKPQLAVLLVLALTGCSGSGRFTDQPGPPAGAASTSRELAIDAPPTNQAVPNNLSPAARSAVSQSADDRSDAGLLECVTESLSGQLFTQAGEACKAKMVCEFQRASRSGSMTNFA